MDYVILSVITLPACVVAILIAKRYAKKQEMLHGFLVFVGSLLLTSWSVVGLVANETFFFPLPSLLTIAFYFYCFGETDIVFMPNLLINPGIAIFCYFFGYLLYRKKPL
ncbi:hypothetical protein [Pseudoalteromonas shioyasakiensis]|uniref:hypothetical protein n=1 Tax=Pseudoalteromonas shioyasakiensis TaxID=1190813 RepID=UPI001C3E1A88|nr:hypothetical protein [Pseudoalteromonas shioyasakiensis]